MLTVLGIGLVCIGLAGIFVIPSYEDESPGLELLIGIVSGVVIGLGFVVALTGAL
jgi:hypothetical protein